MKNDDDDSQSFLNTIFKKNGGKKKPRESIPTELTTGDQDANLQENSQSGPGNFSALKSRLGLDKTGESGRNSPKRKGTRGQEMSGRGGDNVPDDFYDLLEDDALRAMEIHSQAPRTGQKNDISKELDPDEVKRTSGAGNKKESGETDFDARIVTVDQISDASELNLPAVASFEIEEIALPGCTIPKSSGTGILPTDVGSIVDREFNRGVPDDFELFEKIKPETKVTKLGAAKKFSIASLFKVLQPEIVEYSQKIHGPLVDLSIHLRPDIDEVDLYPVNEPYAYIRIIYDYSTHEYTYTVIEPILTDPEKEILSELKERLFETLDINTRGISKEEARQQLRAAADRILIDYGVKLSPVQREKILYNMHKDFLGNGLIDAIMHDKYIEDISCDGVNTPIFAFHANYESMKTTLMYTNAEDLDSFVTKLAQRAGKYISIAEPILDATMTDGSRIQMTLGKAVTAHGSTFTIRKFKDEPISPTDLIEWHTFVPLSIAYIWLAVENGKSAIFAGGTASGKTTTLNAISLFIPPMAKIVSLEDTRELKLPHLNWIPSVTRGLV